MTMGEVMARAPTGATRISWDWMHQINRYSAKGVTRDSKEAKVYHHIKRYLGKCSVFDFNNMMEWDHLYLPPLIADKAVRNGAADKR